eukprot:m.78071 g.78071  ORF g.78071 m.78071 type:complete len:300 (-) comp25073_c0_seq1:214-1113(-)
MGVQDRTHDFKSALDTVRHRRGGPQKVNKRPKREENVHAMQFGDLSRRIHREIGETVQKLEKLQMLVTSSGGLYNDNPVEIENLTYIVKQDINRLARTNTSLKELVKLNGENYNFNPHQQKHSDTVCTSLKNQIEQIKNQFKFSLELRTANLKKAQKRRLELLPGQDDLFSEDMDTPLLSSYIGDEAADVSIQMDDPQQSQALVTRDNYAMAREEQMKKIEETINEVGQIFGRMAELIGDQGADLERIDTNIDNTSQNVDGAHKELVKWYESVSSNRNLMLKIFGTLLLFFIFFIVVLA